MKRRLGYTLIEMLVSITGSTVVLATGAGLLMILTKMDKAGCERLAIVSTLQRLATDFRDDAHAAVALSDAVVEVEGAKVTGWEFQFPKADRKVQYYAVPAGLARKECAGANVLRRELYRLPAGSSISLHREAGGTGVVVLRIVPEGSCGRSPGLVPIRLEAALARDHRSPPREEPEK